MTPPPTSATPHVPPPAGGTSELVRMLVERAAAGDRNALAALFDRYHERVYRFSLAMLGHREDAEDVTSETFLIAWRQLPRYSWTGAPFSSWLFGIARKQVAGLRRRAHRTDVPMAREDAMNEQHQESAAGPDRVDVMRALAVLAPDQREIVVMRIYGGLSAEDIAAATNRTANAVRQLQFRAFKRLAGSGLLSMHGGAS